MKTTAVLALILASATAFNQPLFATRAVGKPVAAKKAPVAKVAVKAAPAKKAAPVAKKVAPVAKKVAPVAKKAAPVAKKAAPVAKKAAPVAKAATPSSKGYPSFAAKTESFRLGKISGGGKKGEPVFLHPTINTAPPPSFDYKEAAKKRLAPGQAQVFVYEDGLTELERKQRATLPAFLTGSAKSNIDKSAIRSDIVTEDFAFGLDSDRFQLLFISAFGLFTLVGCLSGTVSLD